MGEAPTPLCHIDDIPDPGARGFEVETDRGRLDVIIVREGSRARGFLNSCPHQGTPLETFPDRFLTRDRTQLLCTTHGARFRLEDGHCIAGPCKGKALERLEAHVILGFVYLNKSN